VGELFNSHAGEVKIVVASREEETAVFKIEAMHEQNKKPLHNLGLQMQLFA